jgi:hypothetical protein
VTLEKSRVQRTLLELGFQYFQREAIVEAANSKEYKEQKEVS